MGSPNEMPNANPVGHTYSSPLSLETNPGLPDRKDFFSRFIKTALKTNLGVGLGEK